MWQKFHASALLRPYEQATSRPFECGKMLMTENERRTLLRDMLARVNAEWRDLSRASGTEAKLSRMKELRSARLTITSEIFELDRQDRRAS